MVTQCDFLVNDRIIPVETPAQLKTCLKALDGETFLELKLTRGAGCSLTALTHHNRGWLMFLRYPGDVGFSSRDPDAGDNENLLEFRLANGQHDEYPASWCLPLSEVWDAVVHFFEHGDKAPQVTWHDDSGEGPELVSSQPHHAQARPQR
jgi:hypothetical protein